MPPSPSMFLQMTKYHCYYGWVIFHCVYIHHVFFIHASVDRYLGCFHILAVVNNAADIWSMYLFELVFLFSDIYPGVEMLSHRVVPFSVFWETSILLSMVVAPIYIPTNSLWNFPFLHTLSTHLLFVFFLRIVILTGMRWYLIVALIRISLLISGVEHLFMCLCTFDIM